MQRIFFLKQKEILKLFKSSKFSSFIFLSSANARGISKYSENPPDVYGFGHKKYYNHVVRCLEKKEKPMVDGKSGMRSVLLLQSIYKSIESGKEEKVEEKNFHSKLGI